MVLYLIGLGLGDEKDITLKGLEAVQRCDAVYLEHYTSILGVDQSKLEKLYGKKIILADRDLVEMHAEEKLLLPAKAKDVALLVVGDPFGATTHTDLVLRARQLNIDVKVIHNASIMNAIGVIGLELYKYGATTSIPFHDESFAPETPYDVIKENVKRGLHTLCLLDIKVAEPSKQDLLRGKNTKGAPRYMTVAQGLEILLKIEKKRKCKILSEQTFAVGVSRLGQPDQAIKAGTLKELLVHDFGAPLHSLIVPGKLQVVEEEALDRWR